MAELRWILAVAVLTLVVAGWIGFTATRLDRLHVRVDAAYASLDAALVRRCAALQHLADTARAELGDVHAGRLAAAAEAGRIATERDRPQAENAVTKAIRELAELSDSLPPHLDRNMQHIAEASDRVLMARRFYNDAARDTRSLRRQRVVRWLRLAGHRGVPEFFDIDDSTAMALTYSTSPAPASKGF